MHLDMVLVREAVDDQHAANLFFADRSHRLIARFAHGISLQQAAGTIASDLDSQAVATIPIATHERPADAVLVNRDSDPTAGFGYLWLLRRMDPPVRY